MDDIVIYHNPRCTKSRQALALLQEEGVSPHIIQYLDTPPSATELDALLTKLGLEPKDIMRKGEDEYAALDLGHRTLSRQEAIDILVAHPRLIERPIVVRGDRAVVGRPTERVRELLG